MTDKNHQAQIHARRSIEEARSARTCLSDGMKEIVEGLELAIAVLDDTLDLLEVDTCHPH